MKTIVEREKIRQHLHGIGDTVRERLPHLGHEALAVFDRMLAEAVEPLEEIDRPFSDDAKTVELRKAISLLEDLRRARRTGFFEPATFNPLVARTARRVERLARQLVRTRR